MTTPGIKFIVVGLLGMMYLLACSKPGTQFGDELTLSETTIISDILANPENFVGQRVLVKGSVLDVCAMKGCWLEIAGADESEKIKVKVDDGVIVFPMDIKGKSAIVEGNVERIELTEEQAVGWRQHEAEEKGEDFDPSTVAGPDTIYRIRGLGAFVAK